MGFKSVRKCAQNCDMENRKKQWLQSKPTDKWYLELVVKRLRCIGCLNSCGTDCASFKSCRVVPSFYKKMIKRRTIQDCSLLHSIKNGMLLFRAN